MRLSIQISSFIATVSFLFSLACVPEPVQPKPYNYLINGPQDLTPAFSPDGNYIAYFHDAWVTASSGYPTGLYIIGKDGSNRRLVLEGSHLAPAWSPNGRWLVFSSNGTIQKCLTNGDSLTSFTGLNQLTYPQFYYPNWSSDGKYILFAKPLNPDGGLYLTTSNFLTSGRVFGLALTTGNYPKLSPNNATLAYINGDQGFKGGTELFVIDTTGPNGIRLTHNDREDRAPTWSPDGKRIAWSSDIRLSIINADGTVQREITYGNNPSWGVANQIVFSHANSDFTKEVLYLISPDGTGKLQISF